MQGIWIYRTNATRTAWSQTQADLSLQAAAYSLLTGVEQVRFVVLTKTKSPKVQELVTRVDARRTERLRDSILEVDAGIQAGAFPRNVSPLTCGACEFRDRCLGRSAVPSGVARSGTGSL